LWRLDEAREKGELVIVEGESDTLTSWYHNVPCLGIPGADLTKLLTAEALTGIDTVWIVKEPEQGGQTFVAGLAQRLTALDWRGNARVVSLPAKDLNDLHRECGDSSPEKTASDAGRDRPASPGNPAGS
jgi:putative DNA primase/helicase